MNVYNLEAAIGLNTTEYQKGLKAAGESMSSMGDKIKSGCAAIGKAATVAFATIGTAAAAGSAALIKGVGAVADYGDTIDKMSQKLNMSVAAYQEWDAVMQHSGANIETMGAAIKTLSAALETESDVFAKLGLDASALKGMSSEQLFETTITALQNVDSETERTYLASKLLGRGAVELGALLNTSAEDTQKMRDRVHELGGVMSDEAVKAAAAYKDSLQDMKTSIGGMLKGVTGEFMPAFTEVMDGITGIFSGDEGGAALVSKGIDDIMANIGSATGKLKPVFANIGSLALDAIKTAAPKLIKGGTQVVGNIIKGTIKNLPDILSFGFDTLQSMGEGLVDIFPEWVVKNIGKVFGIVSDTFKSVDFSKIGDAFRNFGTSIGNIAEKLGSGFTWLTENIFSPLATWASNDIIPTFLDAMGSGLDLIGSAVDFMKEPALAVWNGFLKPVSEIAGDVAYGSLDLIAKGLKGISDELEGVEWSGFWDDIGNGEFFANWERGWNGIKEWFSNNGNDIDEFFGASGIGASWNKFWQGIGADVRETQETTLACFQIVGHYLGEFVRNWQSGAKMITDAIDSVKNKYKEFKDSWGVGADVIKENSQKTVGGMAFSYLKGKLPGFAEGGRVTQPTIAMIGEREPETIIPDSKLGAVGNTTQNISVTINGAYNIENPESRRSLIEEMSRELAGLGISQRRAVGGCGW